MSKRFMKIFVCGLGLMIGASCLSALTVLDLTDQELTQKAEVIAMGRVLSAHYEVDAKDNQAYTMIHVQVTEYLKGKDRPRELTLKTLGGIRGNMGVSITGAADFHRNEEVMLFLERRNDGSLFPVGMFLGKFDIYRDQTTGRKVVVRSEDGQGKYSAEPREEMIRDLEPGKKVYLDDFRKKIHEFVDRRY